jgi:uncharacterized protein (TIGR00369 family)
MLVCIYIICIYKEIAAMPAATAQAPEPGKTEDLAQMTGRELMQALIDGRLPPPSIAQTLSFRIVEVGDGRAVFEGETGAHLLNPLGGVHGGWALTLIDSATGCAAHTLLPAGVGYATVETKANFTRPIKHDTGRVRAEGRVVSRGRQIMSAEARILDSAGRILSHGTSTLMVFGNGNGEGRTTAGK